MNIYQKLKRAWKIWFNRLISPVSETKLERKIRIFLQNPTLLREAISLKSDKQEQLEFVGDAVLGLVVSDLLSRLHPDLKEGELTVARSNLVNKKILAHKFRSIGLSKYFNSLPGLEPSEKLLSNAFESLLGAIYLDQGYETSYLLIKKWFKNELYDINSLLLRDFKTELQEILQKKGLPLPIYQVKEKNGLFQANVSFNHRQFQGVGNNRKNAEQEAASRVIHYLKNHNS